MFTFKSKPLNSLINAIDNWNDASKKCNQSETTAFQALHDWSLECNNIAIEDVSTKFLNLYKKLNSETELSKSSVLIEIKDLFKLIKEGETKLEKLNESIDNAEKLIKKREKELLKFAKSPSRKESIYDYEIRLKMAKDDKDKLEVERYGLANSVEATKTILFKKHFIKLCETFKKRNEAEKIVIDAMSQMLFEIPDVSDKCCMKDVKYENYENTTRIANRSIVDLGNLSLNASDIVMSNEQLLSKPLIKPKKKNKSRVSCPSLTSNNLYPCLEEFKADPPEPKLMKRFNTMTYKLRPSAPPMSDIESTAQPR